MGYSAVIGANYGDEGKGLVTDWLASQAEDAVVVRFNGGAQAGHTVVTPDGTRHVFHHFGSGTLAGAATHLSRFFIVNPIQFAIEVAELRPKLVASKIVRLPRVYVDPAVPVTTPWDMMMNQAVERKRGDARHGSCGQGINETARRSTHDRWRLTVHDLDRRGWGAITDRIVAEWVPQRMRELGLTPRDWPDVDDLALRRRWEQDLDLLLQTTVRSAHKWRAYGDVIFEGAQGLRLDEMVQYPGVAEYPYVTAGRTGLTNVLTMLQEAHVTERLHVWYVTRPYITRHGPGPLPHEVGNLGYAVKDETNIPNEWQGTLRFAEFDEEHFHRVTFDDYMQARHATMHLAVTCMDQPTEVALWTAKGERLLLTPEEFAHRIAGSWNALDLLTAEGPGREHVVDPRVNAGYA